MVRISVVMPLYNGISYIQESIESIQNQAFTDWEFIVINEYGSDDGCADLVLEYAKSDSRIRLIQNKTRLGLAESLNVGIEAASGEYIARVDVDDPSYPERFEKQVTYMDRYPDVFMCGTLQRSVTTNGKYILDVPCDSEELKAALLFGCEISHCSVMFRRATWIENGFRYDKDCLCEDYDLWTKIMFEHKIVNLPEALVDHRWGFGNISIEKGERLHKAARDVSIRTLRNFGIEVSDEEDFLVAGWRNEPKKYARMNQAYFLKKNYWLLTELEKKNKEKHLIEESALQKILWKRWNWVCKCCDLFFMDIPFEQMRHGLESPIVSIVLPVFESAQTLRETIDSILLQRYTAWELIIVCEYDNWDGSTEIAKAYAKLDKRIRVVCNERLEGLSASLNIGIRLAAGKYIARIDADDLANAARLVTQVAYMDCHNDVGITQFYQHYFGSGANDFIHRPPLSAEAMKAKLLFFCDACHSTVMIRKNVIEQYGLYYDPNAALEDYDLWTRAVKVTKFETIAEVYGEYRVGGNNISVDKNTAIQKNMCQIVARQLKDNLNIDVPEEKRKLLNGWNNYFFELSDKEKELQLEELRVLLQQIWDANRKCKYYQNNELLNVIAQKWYWSKYNKSWHENLYPGSFKEAVELNRRRPWKVTLKDNFKKPLKLVQSLRLHLDAKNIEHLSNVTKDVSAAQTEMINKNIEQWTWERYKRLEMQISELRNQNEVMQHTLSELLFRDKKISYKQGDKIRLVFLYQIASFWPSWDSLYECCLNDERIDARLVWLDETNTEKSQMVGAEEFLKKKKLSYEKFEEFDIESFAPHVIFIQTPYDEWHRKEQHWSNHFKEQGYRIVYIPYGVEISDTEDSHKLHFESNVIQNCWRIYTFSDVMKKDYLRYSENRSAVRALGLPRFDFYINNSLNSLPDNIEKRRKGRKIVLWKVHFPKWINELGKSVMVTPELEEYAKFAKVIRNYTDFFFIFMPHPKFFEYRNNAYVRKHIDEISSILSCCDNVWIDDREDYRESLVHADFIIVDRSAVMVEAGAINVPVLYVSNKEYNEPVTKAIEPLINSYYQANSCEKMVGFLEMCRNGKDPKREVREKAFHMCIPNYDGRCGMRIKEDIVNGVIEELD